MKELFTLKEIREIAYPDATARYDDEMKQRLDQLVQAGLIEFDVSMCPLPREQWEPRWRIPGGLENFDRWCELLDAWRSVDRLVREPILRDDEWRTVEDAVVGPDGAAHVHASQGDTVTGIVLKLHGAPGITIPKGTVINVARSTFFQGGR